MPEIAMVAALEHELWPLVKHWRVSRREYAGRSFRFFEGERSVAVCGGVGAEAARRATEAIIALYHPLLVQSVGFAGALEGGLRVGKVLEPRYVVDAGDGSRVDTGHGADVLVSFSSVAGKDQKSNLAGAYGAQAVDMEAAAVARGAQARGLRFRAVKVISDELGFEMPSLDPCSGSRATAQKPVGHCPSICAIWNRAGSTRGRCRPHSATAEVNDVRLQSRATKQGAAGAAGDQSLGANHLVRLRRELSQGIHADH
jgi:adenosylhomocysteine nucleosidase